jgi:hypothetical protein
LISVLWVLLLLSGLAATSVYVTHTHAILVRRSLQMAQVQAAAEAAIVDTISKLSDEQVTRHGPVDGTAREWEFEGVNVSVVVSKEAERIDLNTADNNLIFAFLRSKDISEDETRTLLDDLRRWRNAPEATMGSSDQSVNLSVPMPSAAQHDLETVAELRQIPSWNRLPLDCWSNALTVYSRLREVSSISATAPALDALKWADEHRLGEREWIPKIAVSPTTTSAVPLIGEVLRIEAHAVLAPAVESRSVWVGRLTGNTNRPVLSMRWNYPDFSDETTCRNRNPT